MAISYNTGTTSIVNNSATAGGHTFTIPAGVLNGDVVLVLVSCFTTASGTVSVTLSSSATTPVPQGSQENTGINAGVQLASGVWSIAATGSDAGATLTFGASGGTGGSYWFNVGLVSYTGAGGADVIAGAQFFSASSVGTTTTPSATTVSANDWQVQFIGAALPSGANFTVPGGLTGREAVTGAQNSSVVLNVADSAATVGGAGTAIGNTTWTASGAAASNVWSTSFTVGIKPPSAAPPAPENPTPPLIPHPLWHELLEVAAQRADWQAQAAPSPARQHWRLMDGAYGRPGTGSSGAQPPAAATANSGSLVNGQTFYVTQSGLWLEGYWWYVTASGGQSTAATKFALWACNANGGGTGGAVVAGSVVTSGTLSAGWNYVPLAQPVQLALYGLYQAAVGLNSGPYPLTVNQTASGQPYSGGWSNGPLVAPSDGTGSNPVPNLGSGATSTAGTDPALVMPTGDSGLGNLFWLDVQVTNAAAASYGGSYRLWPNMNDADYLTQADAAVNYVVATEFTLNQPCIVNAIWYYVSGGMGSTGNQWATSADIWNVHTKAAVASQAAPVWINPATGAADTNSNAGRWVYTQLPSLTILPAGDYTVSVYNGNASPNGWSAKRLGYWQAWNQPPDGTYNHAPPGANGISNGPLYAPTTPLASAATDYSTGATEPGQSTFATGPPNQYPNTYVGQSSSGIYTGPALFQNYWVDVEVTPSSRYGAASVPVTATVTAVARKPHIAGTTPTITASRTAAASPTRHRAAARSITATVTAAAGRLLQRSAARSTTVTITAVASKSGSIHSGGTRPSFTAAVTAVAGAIRHRISSRNTTANITAAAAVTRHRSETRQVTEIGRAHV